MKRRKRGRAGPRSKPSRFEVELNCRVSRCFRNFEAWEIILAASFFHLTLSARIWELSRSEIIGFLSSVLDQSFWMNFLSCKELQVYTKAQDWPCDCSYLKKKITFDSVISSLRRTGAQVLLMVVLVFCGPQGFPT